MIFLVVLLAAGAFGLWQASQADVGPVFLIYLLLPLLAVILGPILAYHAYALYRASYTVERDGLRLRWGLRVEDVPMNEVLWVRPSEDMSRHLPAPLVRFPGAVLGRQNIPGLGDVEFLAVSTEGIVLVATTAKTFALTPEDPQAFLHTMRRAMEYGSLTPIRAYSVYPTFLAGRVWTEPVARGLLLAAGIFALLLFVGVSLVIPGREQIAWHFDPSGQPTELVPAVRLMLLPVLNALLLLVDVLAGMFFFRWEERRYLAYLLWGGAAVTPLLFMAAIFTILAAG